MRQDTCRSTVLERAVAELVGHRSLNVAFVYTRAAGLSGLRVLAPVPLTRILMLGSINCSVVSVDLWTAGSQPYRHYWISVAQVLLVRAR